RATAELYTLSLHDALPISDIGGGYPDSQREDVLISPFHMVPANRIRWPEQTMQWDNLEALRQQKAAEGWIGSFSLPVRSSETHEDRKSTRLNSSHVKISYA